MVLEEIQVQVEKLVVGDVVKAITYFWMSQDALDSNVSDCQKGIPGKITQIFQNGTCVIEVQKRFMNKLVIKDGFEFEWFVESVDKKSVLLLCVKLSDFVKSSEPIPEITAEESMHEVFPSDGHIAVWAWYSPKKPLDKDGQCSIKECQEKQEELAFVNCWGTVYTIYVCNSCHEKYNGTLRDDLPELKI